MDVVVYVQATEAPSDERDLLSWLAERLREAYEGILNPEQFATETHCVRVSFRGSGLDVDVAPVLYEGDPDDKGYLITKDTGERVLTSVPLHLEFIRKRKNAHPTNYAQVVRLIKWWLRTEKDRRNNFRFKSFMVELLCAKLSDQGLDFSDYERAIELVLGHIVTTGLEDRIAFTDYYGTEALPTPTSAAIEMFDPVNPQNNVAGLYTVLQRDAIVDAATDALDAIAEAHHATTKERAVERWKYVLGPSFRG